ncbi:Rv2175c family DNA-binding protein [Nocardioides sp. Bht2]|uniref:Rv2175c family DNA-binding protein n=1 Tax=Nocardioides sp. Bht2 TaxID=3392297 RepID=UPI0039B6860F
MNEASDNTSDLAVLVEEWFDWAEAAKALGVSVNQIRTMIREHQLAAAVPVPGAGQKIPALLIQDGLIVKGVPGLLTVFHDGGRDDRECIEWIFTEQADLPGRPIDALRENRGSEVKRRAQAIAL